jgi:hypothetical protein
MRTTIALSFLLSKSYSGGRPYASNKSALYSGLWSTSDTNHSTRFGGLCPQRVRTQHSGWVYNDAMSISAWTDHWAFVRETRECCHLSWNVLLG